MARATFGWSKTKLKLRSGQNSREGHEVAWEFESPGGGYSGRMLIDGEIYSTAEATKQLLKR
jgi:hypothetical protein